MPSEQERHLARVSETIAVWVHRFCEQNKRFRGASLSAYVAACADEEGVYVSPESALRILRQLRKRGVVEMRVDRAQSMYEMLAVRPLSYVAPTAEPVQLKLVEHG